MKKLGSLLPLLMLLVACGGGGEPGAPAGAAVSGADERASSDDWRPAIETAALPEDPCALIPTADVEAVMGKLAEAPRKADGCRYTLVMPEQVAARRAQAKAMQEKLRKAFGTPEEPAPSGSILEAQNDPRSYAVTVKVDVQGGVEGEQALNSAAKQFGFGGNQAEKPAEVPKGATDWDDVRGIPYGFMGRVGHVRVSVMAETPEVPRDQMRELAGRVRDRIPDRPFAVTNPYQVIQLGNVGDPCSLLTRQEAEAALGSLSVAPYRSSSYYPPLAHGKGHACAYFTPGHHVLVMSPTWSGGQESFKISKGIGGLVGIVAPQEEMVVMKGPWDQSHSGMSGELLFLKGDRLLEVYYGTSRASRGDAVKLAAIAMKRLLP